MTQLSSEKKGNWLGKGGGVDVNKTHDFYGPNGLVATEHWGTLLLILGLKNDGQMFLEICYYCCYCCFVFSYVESWG